VYSGSASASVSSITYDDLYRVTSLNSTARGVKTYGYNSIGNILTNQDFGTGLYQYGAKPHAVTSANGVTYAYDACGNMTNRGNQTLVFDAQNQLVQVTTTNDLVAFGYDDSGERLWRAGTNGYTIWIGGIYEINNGKVLCHVMAGGQLIATFEPQCNAGLARVFGEKNWYVASGRISAVLGWPFREGRGRWTILGGTWAGIMGLCLVGGRGVRLKRHEIRRASGWTTLWRQAVTVLMITAFLTGSIGDVDAAPVYSPVFYFYHPDALGSSNILTDRSGNLVQHYEYGTFGQTSYQNNSSAFPVSNRYTGQIADDETGLYYYGGRYYDPQLGRFIQPDPTIPDPTDSQSFNRYSYCENNPLNETDPSGFDGTSDGGDDGSAISIGGSEDGAPPGYISVWVMGGGIDANGEITITATLTYLSLPSSTLDYGSINSSLNGGLSESEFMGGGFPSPNFSGFPTSPTQPGSGGGWLTGINAALNVASFVPGPVGAIASAAQAGLDLVQGHYVAAGIATAGIALSFIGLGVAAKAIQLARETRFVKNAEGLAIDVNKAAGGITGRGYKSFSAFKRAEGEAGEGQAWHHVVGQTSSNVKRFGAETIQNTENLVKLPHGPGTIHNQISGFYSSKQPFTGGQTVRQWLSKQSFGDQAAFGRSVIQQFKGAP
jgi:RHS repeat-associated protein